MSPPDKNIWQDLHRKFSGWIYVKYSSPSLSRRFRPWNSSRTGDSLCDKISLKAFTDKISAQYWKGHVQGQVRKTTLFVLCLGKRSPRTVMLMVLMMLMMLMMVMMLMRLTTLCLQCKCPPSPGAIRWDIARWGHLNEKDFVMNGC